MGSTEKITKEKIDKLIKAFKDDFNEDIKIESDMDYEIQRYEYTKRINEDN